MFLVPALLMTLALDAGLGWLGHQRPWVIDRPGKFSSRGPANPSSKKVGAKRQTAVTAGKGGNIFLQTVNTLPKDPIGI